MKATIEGQTVNLELTRRNLETLLAKLDDPLSIRTLEMFFDDCEGRSEFIKVKAVENEEHYSDREPGQVYMPTKGVYL